jgi:oligoendopeptidase F
VLVNYSGRLRDVATLAHELGHAVHSMLAEDHSLLTQQPSLPLAETASVFGEMLLTERLLESAESPLAQRELLGAAVDDIYATVMRQAFFVRFEVDAHRAILDNRPADEIHDLYLENLNEQFGDALDIAPIFRHEWIAIPHLYSTPFYCYAYSFGQLLVMALYRRYQEEGEAFKPVYFRLLGAGGAVRPSELLREAGIDAADPAFWQGGFDLVADWIDRLEAG